MRTFAELLTDYMKRVGISDSELARTLGVRRQTIFRWKEGLVEKPRYREDILRIAEKLRLTPEERDELLLAAGFAPERPIVPEPVSMAEPPMPVRSTEPETTLEVPVAAPALQRSSGVRALPRWWWGASLLFVLGIVGGVWFVMSAKPQTALPTAAPGETLIIIAQFAGDFKILPPTPQRQLGEVVTPFDPTARLQLAIEREVRAARLDQVRVVSIPESITDAGRAEQVRQRANAAIVVWGESQDQNLAVGLALAPLASRVDDMPLDSLVIAPTEARLVINSTLPEDARLVALLVLNQLHLARGDWGLARATLSLAFSETPSDPSAAATLNLFAGYTAQISKPPELGTAMQFYSQTIALAPEIQSAFLNRGIIYIRLNDTPGWQADLTRVPDLVNARLALCWAHALDKKPDLALPHCDAAVSRDVSARSREARALAYAQMGRLTEAENDLRIFCDWLARQPESLRVRYSASRTEWLTALQAGKNPIDDAVLDKLRQE